MISFACRCKHRFSLPDDQAGGIIQCPDCGRLNDVPTLDDLDEPLHALDGHLAGGDADPGVLVARSHCSRPQSIVVWTGVPGAGTAGSSRTCLRRVTGTETG